MGLEQLHEPAGGASGDKRALSPLIVRIGRWFFRHRSYTALPLIAAIGLYLVRKSPLFPDMTPEQAMVLQAVATALVASGCLLRLWVLGRAPKGTSGRGKNLEAHVLVTWGAYAYTRNPLYLGNLLICLGICLEVRSVPVALAVLLFFALQYVPVIRAEEDFLSRRFGQQYLDWRAHVPCFCPTLTPFRPRTLEAGPSHAGGHAGGVADGVEKRPYIRFTRRDKENRPPMRWGHAILEDADTWFAAFGGFLALRWWLEGARGHAGEAAAGWFGAILGAYLSIKMIKRIRRRAG